MKNTLIFTLSLLLIVACKVDGTKNQNKGPVDGPHYGGMESPTSKTFTFGELEIGKRICNNLEAKNKTLEQLSLDPKKKIVFKFVSKSCTQPLAFEETLVLDDLFAANVVLQGTDYEFYVPNRSNDYIRDIITNQSGVMREVCDELKGEGEISRQIPVSSFSFTVKFLVKDGHDRVELSQYTPDGKGGYIFNNVEGINFVSTVKQGPKDYLGLEKERSHYTPCSNRKEPAYKIQTWMRDATL